MATTNQAFVKLTNVGLVGSTVGAAGALFACNESNATQLVAGATAVRADNVATNLATAGYAKNGAARHTLSGTTLKTITLVDLTSTTASSAGDTVFASFTSLTFFNDGAADVTVAPGASNPASIGLAGTTPTLTIPAGQKVSITYAAPVTVDSTHKTIDITPTSGGSFILCVGGA